jgi:hypothetical protein
MTSRSFDEIRGEILEFKRVRIKWKWKHNLSEPLGHNKDSVNRKGYH